MTNRNSAKVRAFGRLVHGAPIQAWAAPGFVCGDLSGAFHATDFYSALGAFDDDRLDTGPMTRRETRSA